MFQWLRLRVAYINDEGEFCQSKMFRKIHFPNLRNGIKGVHVSIVEIKSGINLWWRKIPPIERAWRKSLLKFVEFGRPFKLEQWILKVDFDRGMKSIP